MHFECCAKLVALSASAQSVIGYVFKFKLKQHPVSWADLKQSCLHCCFDPCFFDAKLNALGTFLHFCKTTEAKTPVTRQDEQQACGRGNVLLRFISSLHPPSLSLSLSLCLSLWLSAWLILEMELQTISWSGSTSSIVGEHLRTCSILKSWLCKPPGDNTNE